MVGGLVTDTELMQPEMTMQIVDSHTAGEPTRVIIAGGPDLGFGTLGERLIRFRDAFDHYRRWAVDEPRGSRPLVGALLCPPDDPTCAAGVIFFNNAGYLGMCGHGTMGVTVTLAYLGKLHPSVLRLQTPVGVVEARLLGDHEVSIDNVPSYRFRHAIELDIDGLGRVTGDVAWGGNWFFLTGDTPCPVEPQYLRELSDAAWQVRRGLHHAGVTGAGGAEIDHIEFHGPAGSEGASGRNFVLCPGGAYDRSPCGTGTSAKLACLAATGKLQPGEVWVQESIMGSRFAATYRPAPNGQIVPSLRGSAYICGHGQLISQPSDPYRYGIPHGGEV